MIQHVSLERPRGHTPLCDFNKKKASFLNTVDNDDVSSSTEVLLSLSTKKNQHKHQRKRNHNMSPCCYGVTWESRRNGEEGQAFSPNIHYVL